MNKDPLYDRIEQIASTRHVIGSRASRIRTREDLSNLAVDAFNLFSRTYDDSLPYPQELVYLLIEINRAITDKNWEELEELQAKIDANIEYLESWSASVALDEVIAEGGVIRVGSSYIA
jgi:hypothetical protein